MRTNRLLTGVVPARTGQLLLHHAAQVTHTAELARLRADAPLPQLPHLARPSQQSLSALCDWFEALEMKTLLPRLDKLRG